MKRQNTAKNFAKKLLNLRHGNQVRFKFEGHDITANLDLNIHQRSAWSWMSIFCDGRYVKYEDHPKGDHILDAVNLSDEHIDIASFEATVAEILSDHIAANT
jgi:hypothetical protein